MNAPATPPRPVPTRARPYAKTQQPTPLWLRLVLGRELAPSRGEYEAVVDALWDGDPAMDAFVEWMFAYGPKQSRALFTQAMNEGLGSIPDAPEPLRAFFRSIERQPAWLDRELLAEGVAFIHGTGMAAGYVLRDLALMGGYLLSGFNQSLLMTGALNRGTSQRIAETGKWWIDCTEAGGLERFGAGLKSTLHVRMVHALVRRSLAARPDWDSAQWGLPLSQIDMVATYLGFSVVMLGGLRKLGIPVTARESRAVIHLWSYACWLMGVDEKWLVKTEGEGVVLLNHTFMTQSRADWTSRELAQALAREPLERHFELFEGPRRKLAYYQHLSVSRYFLGPEKMEQLGLPEDIGPWYALLSTPPRMIGYSAGRFIPGLRARQMRRGRAEQIAALNSIFGKKEQGLIEPGKDHPARL
jgi:hypothetical protein